VGPADRLVDGWTRLSRGAALDGWLCVPPFFAGISSNSSLSITLLLGGSVRIVLVLLNELLQVGVDQSTDWMDERDGKALVPVIGVGCARSRDIVVNTNVPRLHTEPHTHR